MIRGIDHSITPVCLAASRTFSSVTIVTSDTLSNMQTKTYFSNTIITALQGMLILNFLKYNRYSKNKTNHPISSNSHPSVTASNALNTQSQNSFSIT